MQIIETSPALFDGTTSKHLLTRGRKIPRNYTFNTNRRLREAKGKNIKETLWEFSSRMCVDSKITTTQAPGNTQPKERMLCTKKEEVMGTKVQKTGIGWNAMRLENVTRKKGRWVGGAGRKKCE